MLKYCLKTTFRDMKKVPFEGSVCKYSYVLYVKDLLLPGKYNLILFIL